MRPETIVATVMMASLTFGAGSSEFAAEFCDPLDKRPHFFGNYSNLVSR